MILLSEGGVQEFLDFFLVLHLASRGNRTCRPTASIMGVFARMMLGSVGSGKDTWPNVCPGAIVEGFLLAPKDICIGVCIKVRYNQIIRERRNLFHSADCYILDAFFLTLLK